MSSRLTTRSLCVGRFARRRCRSSTVARPPRQPEKEPQSLLKQGGAEWLLGPSGAPVLASNPHGSFVQWLSSSAQEAKHMVLPRGYPESAAPGYGGYTGWLAAGLFAHSFTVMVSTNALLSGFFAEMSAASWLMKDLLPPLVAGTLASRIHSLEASPHLANPKKWLSAACFANSVLGCAEFLIPHLLPKASWMGLAILTNVGKMTGYLIIGASRAVLQKTLATGAAAGFYAPVRASQCVVMTSVTAVSLRRVVARWAEPRAGAPCGEGGAAPPPGTAAAASVDAAAGWGECPSPEALHAELAARWSVRHSLAARASAWRELFSSDAGQLRVADGAREGGGESPPWTLCASGGGRLLLLYDTHAAPADVIDGFAEAMRGLAAASAASLGQWRRDAASLRASMEAAGWQCSACSVDDPSRRVTWPPQGLE
ncbi:hypothetical protein EMIHUDRAFT_462361 [Emiliania huxleyi CCMP1516]|uniref:Protein root UVB sensitive/RUS domain-containing protein n=2 Tax=Emiliania huxleyi TaxID=2903 RepID=A0A0D3KM44_EMIH1|nr:hypothetical protein EMIHUDRAFT_462361 [Emiliania huxleyi CCMP1516]EOD36829.1 hypothetical protein EMIHUDRAFT_462361 [Emiliania huxleyi CCMP1516]|eukprot:XP_005789258.1 hypothetical protein EMIHUDRAFT_462361 [Emiliania huxleyi CCMP1516]